jgi:hypothetical protein
MTPLLERNEQFAGTYTPAALGIRARQVLIATCLDHRVDPALTGACRRGTLSSLETERTARSSPSWQAVGAGNRFVQYFLLATGAG